MSDIVERLRKHALPDPHDEREVLHAPMLKEAANEIDSLRTQLAEATRKLEEARKDGERMDWLAENFFTANHDMDEFDKKIRPKVWAWMFYAPEGVQSCIRRVIDAARAIEQGKGGDA
jgi:hypothetical protein